MDLKQPIVWVHEESLGSTNPALEDYPDAPALFVFDQDWIRNEDTSAASGWAFSMNAV